MQPSQPLVISGPPHAATRIVLAPGDDGRVDDTAPTLLSALFADAGFEVVRFGFRSAIDSPRERDAALADLIRQASQTDKALVLAGHSRGGRVAVQLAPELTPLLVVAFGYPFHGKHSPETHNRIAQLRMQIPVLICQGTRDSHGNQQQVRGYALPPNVAVHWLPDANHMLCPRARSGLTQREVLAAAVQAVVQSVASAQQAEPPQP